MVESYRNALAMGAAALVMAVAAQFPRNRLLLPVLALGVCAIAFQLQILDRAWAWDSLRQDAAWPIAGILALWTLHSGSGWARVTGWGPAVGVAVVLGDRFAALGSLAEPDPRRRARLVLAASGASLIGWASGAAPLLLGWGGWRVAGLGLVLSLVGYTRGGSLSRERPRLRGSELVAPLLAAPVMWLAAAGGGLEYAAQGIERLPIDYPDLGRWMLAGGALAGGVIADEGTLALGTREILARGLSLRGDEAREVLLAGLAVGGGLPLLLLTGSSMRVGFPLWLVQVAVFAAWCAWV